MVQATVARNLRRVSIGSLDSFLYCWPRAPAFFGEVNNMTSDNSIWGVPCPSDLKRNTSIFIVGAHYFVSRYPQIHYYLLYFAVGASDRTYCAEYETPVLDEIDELFSAKDREVDFVLKGKSLTLRTPKGRKLNARTFYSGMISIALIEG
jgi:hypothetical protein